MLSLTENISECPESFLVVCLCPVLYHVGWGVAQKMINTGHKAEIRQQPGVLQLRCGGEDLAEPARLSGQPDSESARVGDRADRSPQDADAVSASGAIGSDSKLVRGGGMLDLVVELLRESAADQSSESIANS